MPEPMDPVRRDLLLRGMPDLPLVAFQELYGMAKAAGSMVPRFAAAVDVLGDYIAELRDELAKMTEHRTIGGWPAPPVTETWENVTTPPPTSREVCTHGGIDGSAPCRACQAEAKEKPL